MDNLIQELISQYFDENMENAESVPFGITNYTQKVTVNNQKYIARIYDSHSKNVERLKFEIELMSFLEQQNLSFQVPGFVTSKRKENFVQLSNGQLGSIVNFIEGEAPDLSRDSDVKEYGRSVGELSKALSHFATELIQPEIKFYDLNSLHPLCNERSVSQFFERPPFDIDNNHFRLLMNTYHSIPKYRSGLDRLPKQIIHHDLLIFNLLIDRELRKMNGILDFDFASNDVRALELAICLNHLLQTKDSDFSNVEIFLEEYSRSMELTNEEIQWIPYLMQMYYVSLLCIYIGQHYSGRDIVEYFQFILNQWVIRRQWMGQHEIELVKILKSKLL
ncbi:phosphotransferase [Paenibacillus sp. J2TS4]|uniref:phosphotransferase n=1 Tax=Paenibacillus sp. J2TS4 TaxID=2807194 RepID=UPI001B249391|nr:phosphotransferase [Paenibacillus sp. J2TS4]GIP31660.1 hypothetical protein J2TS4_08700 [Paenibacillus sp. J2TS4]